MEHTTTPLNILAIRRRARLQLDNGAVTSGYAADRHQVLELLHGALATELLCMLRYRCHHFMANGIDSPWLAREFLRHSNEELQHADRLAERIGQLGGVVDFAPGTLMQRSHSEYVTPSDLHDMVLENLVAERIAIDFYTHFLRVLGDTDPTTRRMIEAILAAEEKHAAEMAVLLPAPLPQTARQSRSAGLAQVSEAP